MHGYYERFTTDDNSANIDDIAEEATRRQLEECIAANSAVLTAAQLRNIDKKAHESKLVCESLEALYSPMFSTTWQASIEQSGSSSNLQGQPMGRQPPPASSTFTYISKEGELPPKQIHTYLRKEGPAIFDKVQEPMPTEPAHAQLASDQQGTEPQQDEGQAVSLSLNADRKKIIDLFVLRCFLPEVAAWYCQHPHNRSNFRSTYTGELTAETYPVTGHCPRRTRCRKIFHVKLSCNLPEGIGNSKPPNLIYRRGIIITTRRCKNTFIPWH